MEQRGKETCKSHSRRHQELLPLLGPGASPAATSSCCAAQPTGLHLPVCSRASAERGHGSMKTKCLHVQRLWFSLGSWAEAGNHPPPFRLCWLRSSRGCTQDRTHCFRKVLEPARASRFHFATPRDDSPSLELFPRAAVGARCQKWS